MSGRLEIKTKEDKIMEEHAMEVRSDNALTAQDMRAQVNRIQEVMKTVMQDRQHYGTIPGCGNKPTLLKAGAEKLMMTFRLAADPQIEEVHTQDGITFRVTCRITNQQTGIFLGSGVGECSTKEDKYNWRGSVSAAEYNATPEDRRRLKYTRDGSINQVRTNPADLANTALKMAKKRALVDGVLTVTAASDIFTQDIEEMPSEYLNQRNSGGKPPVQPPQSKGPKPITAAQAKRFFTIAKGSGWEDSEIKDFLLSEYGINQSKDITSDIYEEACKTVSSPPPKPGEGTMAGEDIDWEPGDEV